MQYDLELVFVKNSHEFIHEYMKKPEFIELMRRLGALGDGNQDQSKYSFAFLSFFCHYSLAKESCFPLFSVLNI